MIRISQVCTDSPLWPAVWASGDGPSVPGPGGGHGKQCPDAQASESIIELNSASTGPVQAESSPAPADQSPPGVKVTVTSDGHVDFRN